MIDALDPDSVLERAQQAADAGDYGTAERLLRETAAIQEASLGPVHPDLASTLNNLALICDRAGKVGEAERGYRRAHAIAVASLGPRHPFVQTSLKNLLSFCAARGIPVWTPPANPAEASLPGSVATVNPEEAFELETQEVRPSSRQVMTPRLIAMGALGAGVLVALSFTVLWRTNSDSSEQPVRAQNPSPPNASVVASPEPAAPAVPPAPAKPAQDPVVRETPVPIERAEQPRVTSSANVTVASAQVCSALEKRGSPDWACTPLNGSDRPGTFVFYTRLLSDMDTKVEHRWYWSGGLHQVIPLRVQANQSGGYRTYSSNTVSSERAGDWRVELRAADGSVLREERFVVTR